ncbi:cellulose-binding domain-containing protein [Streptomyces sp. NPDC023723]|uniref:cellulose-binding domain-containing protein n=1 Tax=Streptomyces sp. NPDC023723 TaxID=3154323 RepID=UPI0033C2EE85
MSRHLAGCADCAEAAGCLRTDPGSLSAALADGVIGWGGLAYLERRRRAAEVRRAAGRPAPPDEDAAAPDHGTRRTRAVRGGLLGTAALISLLALTASLRPFGDTADAGHDTAGPATPAATAGRRPLPTAPPASTTAPGATPDGSRTPTGTTRRAPAPKPQGTGTTPPTPTSTAAPVTAPTPTATATAAAPACEVHYDLVNQWPDGFQATVTLTTPEALDTWRVSWTFPDGQRITQMWDATPSQNGSRVTVTAAAYNAAVPAGGTLSFGFLAAWSGRNEAPGTFTLNGRTCAGG